MGWHVVSSAAMLVWDTRVCSSRTETLRDSLDIHMSLCFVSQAWFHPQEMPGTRWKPCCIEIPAISDTVAPQFLVCEPRLSPPGDRLPSSFTAAHCCRPLAKLYIVFKASVQYSCISNNLICMKLPPFILCSCLFTLIF